MVTNAIVSPPSLPLMLLLLPSPPIRTTIEGDDEEDNGSVLSVKFNDGVLRSRFSRCGELRYRSRPPLGWHNRC